MTPDEERADILRKLGVACAQPRRTAGAGRKDRLRDEAIVRAREEEAPPRNAPRPRRRAPRKLRLPPRRPRRWLPASPSVLRSTKPRRARRAPRRQPGCAAQCAAAALATTATTAARRATSVARVIVSPARCTCLRPIVRVVATATTATPVVVRAAATRPVAVATCRVVAAQRRPARVRTSDRTGGA